MKLYLAGPWFNNEQDEREKKVKSYLRKLGFDVFSPREFSELKSNSSLEEQQKVFEKDINMIVQSDAVFAITNGKDMGTLFECGYAFANNIPLIYFAEDLSGPFNLMLAKSSNLVYTSINKISFDEINNKIKKEYKGEIE